MIKRLSVAGLALCVGILGFSIFNNDTMPENSTAPMKRVYTLPSSYEEHREQQQWFSSNDGRLAYTDHGGYEASDTHIPTLVLIHGVPTSSWMYRRVISSLQNHMRVVSIDLLGYGASDKPVEPANVYVSEKQAERVAALLAHLQIESYSLLVHDMGGLVGWELLRQQAPVDDLVILNSIVRQEGFNSPTFEKGMFSKLMTKAYSSDMTSSMMLRRTFDSMGMATTHKLSEAECRGYVVPIADGSDVALYSFFTSLNQDLFDRLEQNAQVLSKFEGRSLVMWGGKDVILTTLQIPFLQQHLQIPDENIHIFDEQNHFLAEEIPDKMSELIVEFLTERNNDSAS